MNRTAIGALSLALGLSLAPAALAQAVHLERVPGVFRDLMRSPQVVELPLEGDEEGLLLQIGFPFSYYGQTFTQLGVTTNGYVTFGTAVSPDNHPLPDAFLPNGVLAPFWDDLDSRPSPDSRVLMERTGDAGKRVLTIQWTQYALKADPAARLTFQVLLFEGTNEVLFHYGPMKNGDGSEGVGRASGSSATIGVESPDGSAAAQVSFEQTGVARPGLGYAFLPRAGAPLPEGRRLGDLDGNGKVNILDQSRQVELTSARYRPASALELVAADVAPLDSHGALWGDGTLRISDRDVISQVIVGRVTLAPYLSDLQPGAVAPLSTLTVVGAGFDVSSPGNNVVVLPRSGGGTLEVAAATVNATGSRLTLSLPQDARRGAVYVKVRGRRTNDRTLSVAGVPAILAIAPAPAVIGETLAIGGLEFPTLAADVQVTIGGLPATVLTITTGPDTGLGATRIVTVEIPATLTPGPHAVVVTSGTRVSEPVAHTFGDLPIVALTSPSADAVITDRTTVTGTVQDADLARYELAYAPLEGGEWVTFFTGTGQVADAALGTFDPTMALNGYYRLRLKAIDVHGLSAEVEVTASVQGNLKLGHFTLGFTDFELPASGIAIRVMREYDSRDKKVRDFGVGWALSFVSLEVQEGPDHSVIVDNPESSRAEFAINLEPDNPLVPRFYTVSYRASDPGERSTLDFETPEGVDDGNHILAKDIVGNLFWFPESIPFDPQVYRITSLDGTVLRVHDEDDLLQVIKPTGVTLTITPGGIVHSGGRSVLFTRDAVNRITKITDPNGNFQTYEYDPRGDLVRQTDALGFASTFTYLQNHHLSEWFDARGVRATKNEYDDAGRLVATTDPLGNRLLFERDIEGRREITRDKAGRPTITEYDARGRAVKITGPDGAFEAFTHNDRNQVLTRRDLNGHLWTYAYDSRGNQTSFTDPEGRSIGYAFDDRGHTLSITDADQGVTSYQYDAQGNVTREQDAAGGVVVRAYNDRGDCTSVTDEGGETTLYSHNQHGDVTKKTEPNGQVTLYTHDAAGNVLTEAEVVAVPGQPSVRSTWTYGYNAANQRASVKRPDGTETTWRHGAGGRLVERLDTNGGRELFAHDELGRLKERIGGDGRVEQHVYDALGQLAAITDATGRRAGEYDARGYLKKITFPDGTILENVYDPMGRRVARVDARGRRWTYEHDATGRVLKEVDPSGAETTFAYNGKGQLTSKTDPDLRTSGYEYDGVGRLSRIRYPDGRTEEVLVRDSAGHVTRRTDVFGRTTEVQYGTYETQTQVSVASGAWSYGYDKLGRVTSQTDPLARSTTFGFDALTGKRTTVTLPLGQTATATWENDRPATLTDFDGKTTGLEHDGRGNLTYRVFPDGTGERLTYDAEGRLQRIEEVRGDTVFERDTAGKLTARTEPDGRRLGYGYDREGFVARVETPAGTIALGRDDHGRVTSVTDVTSQTTTFVHSAAGVLRTIARPGAISTAITTDPMGRTESITHTGPFGLIGYGYGYDERGLRNRVSESSGRTVDYVHDEDARLVSEVVTDVAGVTSTGYTYDAAGNRLTKSTTRPDGSSEQISYVFDRNDRIEREDVADSILGAFTVAYTHDQSGRLLARTSPTESLTLGYDGLGRLVSAVVVRGSERREVGYAYDHFGHLARTTRDGVVTNHLVDTNRSQSQIVLDTDAQGTALRSYAYGSHAVSQRDAAGQTLYFLQDGQGSTRTVVDGSGTMIASYTFDAYGVLAPGSGSDATNVLYTGERFDPLTGLYYLRSRWLDPRTGRFLTRDTFEGFPFDPPTLHPYAYALNSPVNRIDPPGTFSTNLQCMFAMDLPNALAGLDGNYMDVRARRMNANTLTDLLSSLNVFIPDALNLIESDRDLAIAYALVAAALEGPGPERHHLNARSAPGRAARTYLFGAKVYGRMGSDVLLGMARAPGQDAGSAHTALVKDDVVFGDFGDGTPEPVRVNSQVAQYPLFKEIQHWLGLRDATGEIDDLALFEEQRDGQGNRVGFNHPHLAFTVTSSNLRWNFMFASADVPTADQLGRLLRNDPRSIAIELREDATMAEFLDALRTGGDFGPPAPFVLSFSRTVTGSGLPVILREALPQRNKRLPLSPSSITAGVGVYAHNGEFMLERTPLKVEGPGLPWEFRLVYRSGLIYPDVPNLRTRFVVGHGWTHNFDTRVGDTGGGVILEFDGQGRYGDVHRKGLGDAGEEEGATFEGPPGVFASLAQTGFFFEWLPTPDFGDAAVPARMAERGYIRLAPNGTQEGFNAAGWLVWQKDRHGNELKLLRDENHVLRLVIDTTGRRYRYEYEEVGFDQDARPMLARVVDETGERTVTLEYDPLTHDLVAVTSPGGRTERYEYSQGFENPALNHNMTKVFFAAQVSDPRNQQVPAIVNVYKTDDPAAIDFDGVTEQLCGGTTTVTKIAGGTEEVPSGGTTRFAYEELNPLLFTLQTNEVATRSQVTDRRGRTASYEFNRGGNPIKATDELGHVTRHRYSDDGLRVETTFPNGQRELLGYDTKNPIPTRRANLVWQAQFSAVAGERAIVTEFDYDPFFNQLRRVSDTEAFEPVTEPPAEGIDARAWLQPSDAFEFYSNWNHFDYQEGPKPGTPIALSFLFGFNLDQLLFERTQLHARWGLEFDLGDRNADDQVGPPEGARIDYSGPGFRGVVVEVLPRPVHATHAFDGIQRSRMVLQYNTRGQVTLRTDSEGNVTRLDYFDPDEVSFDEPYSALTGAHVGYLEAMTADDAPLDSVERTSTRLPVQARTTFAYDAFGQIRRVEDAVGSVTLTTWDPDGVQKEILRGADDARFRYLTKLAYDGDLRPVQVLIEDKGPSSVAGRFFEERLTYDLLGSVLEQGKKLSDTEWLVTRHSYDEEQLRKLTTFPEGNQVAWEYDERRLRSKQTRGPGTPEQSVLVWAYNGNKSVTSLTLPDQDQVLYRYDGFNRLMDTVAPNGSVERRFYDAVGELVATERRGRVGGPTPTNNDETGNVPLARVDFVLDEKRRLVEERYALFGPGLPNVTVSYKTEYDRMDRQVARIDPEGERTSFLLDGLSRVVETRDALQNRVANTFDPVGNLRERVEVERSSIPGVPDDVFRTTLRYDTLNRLIEATDSALQTTRFEHDSRDNVVVATDAMGPLSGDTNLPGNKTTNVFDRVNRLVETIHDLTDDGLGGGELDLTNQWNEDGQVRVRYEHDKNSRLTAFVDDLGQRTTYAFDALDRRVAEILADGARTEFAYHPDDTIRQITDPNGSVIERTHDSADRLIRARITRGAGVRGTTLETYEYDGLDRVVSCLDDNGSTVTAEQARITRAWDSLSRLVEESQNGRTFLNTWSPDGKRLTLTYPGGRALSHGYDGIDRLTSVSDAVQIAGCEYMGPDVRTLRRTNGNGTILSFADDPLGPTRAAGYDQARRVVSLKHHQASGTAFLDRAYGYNRANRRTQETRVDDGGQVDRYARDSLQRITGTFLDEGGTGTRRELGALAYLLDGVGNRRQVTEAPRTGDARTVGYEVNTVNQYVKVADVVRSHDKNGNVTDDGRFTYEYDYRNRIVAVQRRTGGGLVARYLYDCENRRIAKLVFDPDAGDLRSTVRFFYDGWREVEEQDGAGTTLATYVYGPVHMDDVLQLERTVDHPLGAGAFYLHQDARGNVVGVTDKDGLVVERRFFDDFGNAFDENKSAVASSAVGNAYGFQGRRLDEETGLYYFRHRTYDPATGRFLQRDPVWDGGGLGNQYTFGWNDPGSLVDPTGEFALMLIFSSASAGFLYGIANALQDVRPGLLSPVDRARALQEGFMGALMGGAFGAGMVTLGFGAGAIGGVGMLFQAASVAFSAQMVAEGGTDLVYGLKTGDNAMATRGAINVAAGFLNAVPGVIADGDGIADRVLGEGVGEFDNCFVAGTLVVAGHQRSAGQVERVLREIQDVKADDLVLAQNPATGEVGWKRVKQTFQNWTNEVWSVRVGAPECMPLIRQAGRTERHTVGHAGAGEGGDDGEPPPSSSTIRCTAGHPWRVRGADGVLRWEFTASLRVCDRLVSDDGTEQVVLAVDVHGDVARTFNFEVKDWRSYYVTGDENRSSVLVHNTSIARLLRMKAAARAGRSYASDVEHAGRRARDIARGLGARANRDVHAVGVARDLTGARQVIVAGRDSGRVSRVAGLVRSGEHHIPGVRGLHAEESVEAFAKAKGWRLVTEGATLEHCVTRCVPRMERLGIRMASPRGQITRRLWNETARALGY